MNSSDLIKDSRELVDHVLETKKLDKVKKSNYFMFAVSNFIAIKEFFLKKVNGKEVKVVYDCDKYPQYASMMLAFFNRVTSKGYYFDIPPVVELIGKYEIRNSIYDYYAEERLLKAMWLINTVRNSLSHNGGYHINLSENTIDIFSAVDGRYNNFTIPIEMFDYIAFYFRAVKKDEKLSEIEVHELYQKYKKEDKVSDFYGYAQNDGVNALTLESLQEKRVLINGISHSHELSRSFSDDDNFEFDEELPGILEKISYLENYDNDICERKQCQKLARNYRRALIAKYKKNPHALKRVSLYADDISGKLNIDLEETVLFSHSVILFSNKVKKIDPPDDLSLAIYHYAKTVGSVGTNAFELVSDDIKEKWKISVESFLQTIQDLKHITMGKKLRTIRNAVFHCNIEAITDEKGKQLHFWDQKDNTIVEDHSNDGEKFEIHNYSEFLRTEENDTGKYTLRELYLYVLEHTTDRVIAHNIFNSIYYFLVKYLGREISHLEYPDDIIKEIEQKSYGGR